MKCPFELPVEAQVSAIDSGRRYITGTNGYPFICGDADKDNADYIVQAINSHEKLVDLANDLEHGLRYLRQTKAEPYGFGIDRLEEKLQALKKAGEPK